MSGPANQPRILMCSPEHYGIHYEINPWMSRLRPADLDQAHEQWNRLRALLESLDVEILLQPPVPGLPDLVFTANAALIFKKRAIVARFHHPQRQGESPHDWKWFADHGFTPENPPLELSFEGAGDALFCGHTLFAGYRMRSAALGHQLIAALLGCRVIPLELVDPYYYHLDTCFCPLAIQTAAWFPSAFDRYAQQAIREHIPELIEISPEESRSFACNAVVVGRHVVTNTGCDAFHAALRRAGFEPHGVPLSEFVKAGGSAKCLTLRLDGEEAAAWKNDP